MSFDLDLLNIPLVQLAVSQGFFRGDHRRLQGSL